MPSNDYSEPYFCVKTIKLVNQKDGVVCTTWELDDYDGPTPNWGKAIAPEFEKYL